MKKFTLISLAAGVILLGTIYPGQAQASGLEEKVTATSERTVTPREKSIMSTAALKVLRHIAGARADIHEKNIPRAQNELKQAHTLLEIIKATEPTEEVKDRIWIAKKHLFYESTQTVMDDMIPIYTSLDDIEALVPTAKAREHINNAKKYLEKGIKKSAAEELELADESLVYSEIDLPRKDTEKHITDAQNLLSKNEVKKADAALKAAQEGVEFFSFMTSAPVVQVKNHLWLASKNYAAGELAAAKGDMQKAEAYLDRAARSGDAETKAEAENLMNDVKAVEGKIDNGAKETGQEIRNLYERAKDLARKLMNFKTGGNQAAGNMEK